MKNPNFIQDFQQRVNLYFDNQLNENDQQTLLNQVSEDPQCDKMFQKEKNFRDFIKNNVKRSSVSPDLIQSIKNKVRIV